VRIPGRAGRQYLISNLPVPLVPAKLRCRAESHEFYGVFLDYGLVQYQNTAGRVQQRFLPHPARPSDIKTLPLAAAYFALNVKLTGTVSLPVTVTSWV
jgi:hypothetical protein